MSLQPAAELAVLLIETYLGFGLLSALPFVLFGVQRVDAGAKGTSLGFRLLILPGAAALWPVVLYRYVSSRSGEGRTPEEHNAHRDAVLGARHTP